MDWLKTRGVIEVKIRMGLVDIGGNFEDIDLHFLVARVPRRLSILDNLTRLSLNGMSFSEIQFNGVYFPVLDSLTLYNVFFDDDTCMEKYTLEKRGGV
jgi:hypothetical protein